MDQRDNQVPLMDTMMVTSGTGPFAEFAPRVARLFKRLNGTKTMVIDEEPEKLRDPGFIKAYIWDLVPDHVERVVWVDADVVPFRSLPLEDVFGTPFAAVLEANEQTIEKQAAKHSRFARIRSYFQSGVFVCDRSSVGAFDALKLRQKEKAIAYREQSWLNVAVEDEIGGFQVLSSDWNWLLGRGSPPRTARMLHYSAGRGKCRFDLLRNALDIAEMMT